MNEHDARILVKDTIFDLTMTAVASHLWGCVPLSDVGIGPESPESILSLSLALGIDSMTIKETMTLEELTRKVVTESRLRPQIVKEGIFELLI